MTTTMTDPSPRLVAALTQSHPNGTRRLRRWLAGVFGAKPSTQQLRDKPDHLLRDIGLSESDISWLREVPENTLIR